MNVFAWISSILAILIYIPMWMQIRRGSVEQNLLTWLLWGALDGIATATIIFQKGNFLLPAAYTICSLVTTYFILRTGKKSAWTRFESFVTMLVLVSIIAWYSSGSRIATIASTIAVVIAGIPQIVDAWKDPRSMPLVAYIGFSVANALAIVAGKNWSIEERFYPVCIAVMCYAFVAVICARWHSIKPGPEQAVI